MVLENRFNALSLRWRCKCKVNFCCNQINGELKNVNFSRFWKEMLSIATVECSNDSVNLNRTVVAIKRQFEKNSSYQAEPTDARRPVIIIITYGQLRFFFSLLTNHANSLSLAHFEFKPNHHHRRRRHFPPASFLSDPAWDSVLCLRVHLDFRRPYRQPPTATAESRPSRFAAFD